MHGLTRLLHLSAFADGIVREFAGTVLPAMVVRPFAIGLVFVEAIVGLLVLLGLFTRAALILGSSHNGCADLRHCAALRLAHPRDTASLLRHLRCANSRARIQRFFPRRPFEPLNFFRTGIVRT